MPTSFGCETKVAQAIPVKTRETPDTELAKTYHVSVDWLLELSDEIEIVDIINEKFKTENVKVKVRKLVTAFPGSYYSENKNILFRMD